MSTSNQLSFNSIVTGGLGGIGSSICKKLKNRGDNVFILDTLSPDHNKIVELKNSGFNYFQVDISKVDSIKKVFEQIDLVLKKLKNTELNLLVNNAGITKDNLALRLHEEDWDLVLDVNLKGSFFCCQQALKKMIRQQKSYIINISSVVGITGNIGQVNYTSSKAGVIALTMSLAAEYGKRNVLINSIAPGFIKTGMTEQLPEKLKEKILQRISLEKFGKSEDVANLVEFLTSGSADYITGQVIRLDGGLF